MDLFQNIREKAVGFDARLRRRFERIALKRLIRHLNSGELEVDLELKMIQCYCELKKHDIAELKMLADAPAQNTPDEEDVSSDENKRTRFRKALHGIVSSLYCCDRLFELNAGDIENAPDNERSNRSDVGTDESDSADANAAIESMATLAVPQPVS